MAALVKNFWQTKKKMVIYAVATLFAFTLTGLWGYDGLISDPNVLLMVFQAFFFGFGMLHVWGLYSYMEWDEVIYF